MAKDNPLDVDYVRPRPPEEIFRELLSSLGRIYGDDPKREGLQETPKRMAKAYGHWLKGYGEKPEVVLKVFEDGAARYDEMVFQGRIPFFSLCEHHLAPFFGYAYIAYIPENRIVGLSKFSRLIDVFARRLQVQERMVTQIVDTIETVLKPKGVACTLQARHMCMESRGVERMGAITETTALRGLLKEPDAKAEFEAKVSRSAEGLSL